MKVAVYAIALNEEKFVEKWFESCKEADYLLIADTGSTDKTVELAKSLGINVVPINISPWRFDTARNASLALIPLDVDYCIALDMDEELQPGWRKHLQVAFNNNITRPRYTYTWNWNADGTPGLQYQGDKIHTRKGYVWKHPVHEVMKTDRIAETQMHIGLEIHHHADDTKSRGQYLNLLELSVEEDPHDDRNSFYYGRELFMYGLKNEAKKELMRHLELPKALWVPERAASMRMIAKCCDDISEKIQWFEKAINEAPGRREALVDLSFTYYTQSDWDNCKKYAMQALEITTKPLEYLCEADAWGYLPHDLLALSEWHTGNQQSALMHGRIALELLPNDERLINNLNHYLGDIQGG